MPGTATEHPVGLRTASAVVIIIIEASFAIVKFLRPIATCTKRTAAEHISACRPQRARRERHISPSAHNRVTARHAQGHTQSARIEAPSIIHPIARRDCSAHTTHGICCHIPSAAK